MKFTTPHKRWIRFHTVLTTPEWVKAVCDQGTVVFDGTRTLFDKCFEKGFFESIPTLADLQR